MSYNKFLFWLPLKSKTLFFLTVLSVTCPLWGQTNNDIKAYLEKDRLIIGVDIEMLDKPMLFVRHGAGHQQVVWSKHNDYILLTASKIESLAGTVIPLYFNYKIDSNIIGRFPIIKEKSTENSFFVDATDLLLQTHIRWNLKSSETVYRNLSYIKSIGYLENETIIKTKRTVDYFGDKRTIDVDFSFYKLPEPMTPRLFDYRMGFLYEDVYSALNSKAKTVKGNIAKWRLEKKYKDRKLSEPINPIVFYLDPAIPEKWRLYVKAGVREWLPAFEAAGFKNAIEIREVSKINKNWHGNSVNRSVIRWSNYTGIRGAGYKAGSTVNHIIDLRSGEILKADIIIGSSYQSLSEQYLVRCAPLDKRAQQYPFPDELVGELIQYITAHEAGHAFGLRDGHYGEYAYPVEKMRDKNWLEKMGHTPSIMSYARHNHVAQPEDSIPPSLLIQKVGPMDYYQIKWGYKPFSKTNNPKDKLPYLEKIVGQQDSVSWYRFNMQQSETLGPGSTNEVVENDNPIQSIKLSLKNLKRVVELLPAINKKEPDNILLARLYNKVLELWYHQMQQVMSLVGGYTIQYKSGEQKGDVYSPISSKSQEEALDFLLSNAFEVPEWLSRPDFLSRIQYSTNADKLLGYQKVLLSELIDARRMKRLEQIETYDSFKKISEILLSKLSLGLFRELRCKNIAVERRRQELQRAYVELLVKAVAQENNYTTVNPNNTSRFYSGFSKSILMSELLSIREAIGVALKLVEDKPTIGHLELCMKLIDKL